VCVCAPTRPRVSRIMRVMRDGTPTSEIALPRGGFLGDPAKNQSAFGMPKP
jgi:hypothetical protein